jgi:flagellar hook protein FlgE
MVRSLNSGVSGLQQFQERMDVIGNNIANVNTTGYKSARAEFADAFSQTLRSTSVGISGRSGMAAMQVGSGVVAQAVKNNFTQGTINATGVKTDLAVDGDGFFVVRDVATSQLFVTRAGEFRKDTDGYLVTNTGLRVQGFSDSTLATRGDIRIDNTNDGTVPHAFADAPANTQPVPMKDFRVDTEGRIWVQLDDAAKTQYVRGQILLQNFRDPQALIKEGNNLYSGIAAAGPLGTATAPQSVAPNSNGLGRLQIAALETSNVDLTSEFANLIATQRAFQASARIITSSDELLQEVVNLKR